ncbi:MAG: MFS transporter [Bacillota bacterium]
MLNRPWRFALAELTLGFPMNAVLAYLLFYYTDHLGLAVSMAAIARSINAIWDGVNDPIFGHLSDRTRTRWGRRRPWLFIALPAYVVVTALAWIAPVGASGMALFWIFLATMLIYETIQTICWVNYNSLFPQLFPEQEARLRTNALRKAFGLLSLLGGVALAPLLFKRLGYPGMGLVMSGIALVALIPFLSGLREPQAPPAHGSSILGDLRKALSNPTYRTFLWVYAFINIASMIFTAGMPFFAKYSLGLDETGTSMLYGTIFLVALPSTAFWAWLGRRMGGPKAWALSILVYTLSCLPGAVVRGLGPGLVGALFSGFGLAGVMVLQDVVLSAIIDEDAERTGEKREGVFFGILSVFGRLSGVLQAGAFALLTPLFGYVSGQNPGSNPELAFRFLMVGIAGSVMFLGWLVARRLRVGDAVRPVAAGASTAS